MEKSSSLSALTPPFRCIFLFPFEETWNEEVPHPPLSFFILLRGWREGLSRRVSCAGGGAVNLGREKREGKKHVGCSFVSSPLFGSVELFHLRLNAMNKKTGVNSPPALLSA